MIKQSVRWNKMDEILGYLETLNIGPMQQHRNMSVLPLLGKDSRLEYLVLDEAVKQGLIIKETRTVAEVYAENQTEKNVLLLIGEYLVGGWQNRMMATNAYLAKDFKGSIPARCVQQHRWSMTPSFFPNAEPYGEKSSELFSTSERRVSPSVMMAASLGSQGDVWNQVSYLMESTGAKSATHNIGDIYDIKKKDISEYVRGFDYAPGCVGMIIGTPNGDGSKRYSIELFDRKGTMRKQFGKIIESYALEAVAGNKELVCRRQDLAGFLRDVKAELAGKDCSIESREPVSLGKDLAISGEDFEGLSLVYKGIPVYTNFCSEKYKQAPYDWPNHPIRRIPLPEPYPRPFPRPHPRPWEPEGDFPPYIAPHDPNITIRWED
jgi:hypothetical protein